MPLGSGICSLESSNMIDLFAERGFAKLQEIATDPWLENPHRR